MVVLVEVVVEVLVEVVAFVSLLVVLVLFADKKRRPHATSHKGEVAGSP